MNKKITIEIEESDDDSFGLTLDLVVKQIKEGYIEGMDRSDDGRYHFSVEEMSND